MSPHSGYYMMNYGPGNLILADNKLRAPLTYNIHTLDYNMTLSEVRRHDLQLHRG